MYPAYYIENPRAIYSYEAGFGIQMHQEFIKIKNKLNVTYAAFFNLGTGGNNSTSSEEICKTDPMATAMCFYVNLSPSDCYKELNVDVSNNTEMNRALELAKSVNQSFIIQAGDGRSVSTFRNAVNADLERMGKIFYLPFLTNMKDLKSVPTINGVTFVLRNFEGYLGLNHFFHFAFDFPTILLKEMTRENYDSSLGRRLLDNESVQKKLRKFFHSSSNIEISLLKDLWRTGFLETALKTLMSQDDSLLLLMDFWKQNYYIEHINEKTLIKQWSFNPSEALKSRPYCDEKKPFCNAGVELVHSFYKEEHWTQSYGWNCRICPDRFYKPEPGNDQKCIGCFYPNTVDKNRTKCYDPFTKITLKIDDLMFILVVGTSTVMALMTLMTMILFFVKRETPIVKLANRTMTTIQLLNHLLLFVLPSLLFLMTSPSICMLRQPFLGVSFSITLSINISKSQKLYMIVTSKVRMSNTEILMTKASEWIIILVALIVNALLHLLSLINKEVTVDLIYFDQTLTKEFYCSNDIMVYIQLFIAAALSLCNGIQGFRARKLPSRFQETNHVIYSSFISTVVFVAATAAYFSRKSMVDRSFIVLLVTTIYNSVHFVLLYGYKLFIVIFRPHLNTKEAFTKKRLDNVAGGVNKV